ncbi:hypothetical protein HDV05_005165 [Chytridiales sp. JEL 0842]|nr:hypothetical protein HDV05_005165 [Chytridiales sp. JEL 0842]
MPSPTAATTTVPTLKPLPASRVDEAIEFIATHNKGLPCMLVDETPEGIKTDFKNFDIDPTRDLYYVPRGGTDSPDSIVGLVGLLLDKESQSGTFIGPWTSTDDHECSYTKSELIQHLLSFLSQNDDEPLKGITKVSSGMVTPNHGTHFSETPGFKFNRNDTVMQLDLSKAPTVHRNPDVECRLLRIGKEDEGLHEQTIKIHESLFKLKDYGASNWYTKFDDSLPDHDFLVVGLLEGKVVGYAILQRQLKNIYVAHVGTDEKYQRRKVGSSVLLKVREWFAQSGFAEMHLNVEMKKEHAGRLYEGVGFKVKSVAESWVKEL